MIQKRKCKKCGEEKELEKFSKSSQCKLGYRYVCKECKNKRYIKKGPCVENPSWFKKGHLVLPGAEKGWLTKERLVGNSFRKGKRPHNYIDGKGVERAKKLRSKLNEGRLRKLRLEILERDKFKCVECNNHNEMLHMHHKVPLRIDLSKAYDRDNVITVCPKCHAKLEKDGKMNAYKQ